MSLFYLLTAIVCGAYVLLMLSYIYGWQATPPRLLKPQTPNPEPLRKESFGQTKVSVIIPARNEEHNILNCLSSIQKQTYPADLFEVIVVDDHSIDRTQELAESQNFLNLKIISLSENRTGKKAAIAEGIKNAGGTLIITTDADCEMGEEWLSAIVSFYEEEKPKMIVAPVLLKDENSFQQIMQSQEMTVLTACAGASLYWNKPILCSGANLAYEKNAFLAVNGFEGVDKTATGDDIFLMLKFHDKFPGEINYLRSKEVIVYTHPERTSAQALRQRKRWASKSFSYSLKDESGQSRGGLSYVTWIAALIFFTNFLILISGIMCTINLKFALVPAICFFAKFLVDFMLLYSASSFFSKKIHPFVFVLASVIYPIYVSFMGLISPFTNYSWKGRKS